MLTQWSKRCPLICAYLPCQVDLEADVKASDKLEINANALDTRDAESISAQAAAQAWNAQHVSILL